MLPFSRKYLVFSYNATLYSYIRIRDLILMFKELLFFIPYWVAHFHSPFLFYLCYLTGSLSCIANRAYYHRLISFYLCFLPSRKVIIHYDGFIVFFRWPMIPWQGILRFYSFLAYCPYSSKLFQLAIYISSKRSD